MDQKHRACSEIYCTKDVDHTQTAAEETLLINTGSKIPYGSEITSESETIDSSDLSSLSRISIGPETLSILSWQGKSSESDM